jgi:aminoglycoside phosphotransferase family enzyme
MTKEEIDSLLSFFSRQPAADSSPLLIETHISWVIMTGPYAYKIKKPLKYTFLDFSTLEKRKAYCQRELTLNRRLTEDIYLGVVPVKQADGNLFIADTAGETIDYAVKMKKMNPSRRMDLLLREGKVTPADIRSLAARIAAFHQKTEIIPQKDIMDIPAKFADLASEKDYLRENLLTDRPACIGPAIETSTAFLEQHRQLVAARTREGFIKDCHGDLHTRNIFLLSNPQPFDCIEFNDDLRQIDVLNEIAFLCMDLDAFGRQDLSTLFLNCYNDLFPALRSEEEKKLFIYFKSYRANIRAKINSFRARSAATPEEKTAALAETDKYLKWMKDYLEQLSVTGQKD